MTDYNKIYLVSPDDCKANSQINYNVDEGVLGSAIREAQSVYLRDIIGKALLEKVQDLVVDGSIDAEENVAYLDLLDNYIFHYLVAKTQVCIIPEISLKIRNIGLSQDSDANIMAASINNLDSMADYYETQACDKANRMICFLLSNKKAFPELNVCGCSDCEKPHLTKQANTRLWLGK